MAAQKNIIIYDSDYIRVVHQPGDQSRLAMLTFSPATQYVNGSWFWGEGIAKKSGLEVIGVVAQSDNWFPMAEMQRSSEVIRKTLSGHTNIVGFGTSMGGYGVLKYGRLLGITHGLAFVPQWSINPADVSPWDKRFVRHFDPLLHASVSIKPGDTPKTAAIFYDPFMKLDRMNFEKIAAANPHCVGIKSFFTAHSSIETVKGTDSVMELFEFLLGNDFGKMQRRATQARRDKATGVRPLALATILAYRNVERAHIVIDAHSEKITAGQKADLHNDFACILYNKGQYREARRHSLIATGMFFDHNFQIRLSMIERKLGHQEAALAIARDLVMKAPKSVGASIHLATMLAECGQKNLAIEGAERVLAMAPLSIPALQLLVDLTDGEIELKYVRSLCRVRPDFRSNILLGDALNKLANYEEATEAYKMASNLKPAEATPYQKIANVFLRAERWSDAICAARRAVSLAPENAACYLSLARALSGAGSDPDALNEVQTALRFVSDHNGALALRTKLMARLSIL